jgi:hypothetical protein
MATADAVDVTGTIRGRQLDAIACKRRSYEMTRSRLIPLFGGLLVAVAFVATTASSAYAQPPLGCYQTAGKGRRLTRRGLNGLEEGNLERGCTVLMVGTAKYVKATPRFASGWDSPINGEEAWCAEVERNLERGVKGFRNERECEDLRERATEPNAKWVKVIGVRVNRGGGRAPRLEILPSVKTFKGLGSLGALSAAGTVISCEEAVDAGEITGMSTIGKLVITFTGCQVTSEERECTIKSASAKEGEIVTNTLMGELGTTKSTEAASEVGLLLLPQSGKSWTRLSSTKCTLESVVEGSLAGEVQPISEKTQYVGLGFGVSSGKQDIEKITVSSGVKEPELVVFGLPATAEFGEVIEFTGEVEIV